MLFNSHVYFVCIYVYPIHWPGGHWPGGYSSSVRTSCESIGVGTDPRHLSNLTHCSWPYVCVFYCLELCEKRYGAMWKDLQLECQTIVRMSPPWLVTGGHAPSPLVQGLPTRYGKAWVKTIETLLVSINSFSDSTRLLASLLFKISLKVCLGRRMTSKFQCKTKKLHLPARDVLTCQFQDDVSCYPSLTVQPSWSNSPRLATWHLQFLPVQTSNCASKGMVLSWLDLCCQSLDLTPGFDAKRNLTAITTQQNNWRRRINRRIKGTYSTWRYKSVRLPTGAPREQQLHSTYHLRGSVSLVKPSVNSKKLFALKRIDGGIWSFNCAFCAWSAKAISLMLHSKVHLISCHATPEKHLPKDISSYAAFVSYDERHNHTSCACAACTSPTKYCIPCTERRSNIHSSSQMKVHSRPPLQM